VEEKVGIIFPVNLEQVIIILFLGREIVHILAINSRYFSQIC
jgi:hypothetical protein